MAQPQLAIEYAIVPESVGAVRGISEKNKILPVARFRRDKFFLKRWGGFAYTPTFSKDILGCFFRGGNSPKSSEFGGEIFEDKNIFRSPRRFTDSYNNE